MPIAGLTTNVAPKYPCLGKLRKGGEKPAKAPGRDLDHFRFTAKNPEVQRHFEAAYPTTESRREIRCYVLGADPETAFDAWYESWSAATLLRRCDGETIHEEFVEGRYQSYRSLSPDLRPACKNCPASKSRDACKPVGRLAIVIKELLEAGHVGFVTVETHSNHDLRELTANLQAAAQTFGRIDRVPFLLRRVETEISTPREGGDRARVKKWLLNLQPEAAWVAQGLALASDRFYRQSVLGGQSIEVAALPAADAPDFDDDDGELMLPAVSSAPRHAETVDHAIVWNFYRSLEILDKDFDQCLRNDCQRTGVNPEAIAPSDLPRLVGSRLGEVGAATGVFGEDYEAAYLSAKTESGDWLRANFGLRQRFADRQYGAIGRAWIQHLEGLAAQLLAAQKEPAAATVVADPEF